MVLNSDRFSRVMKLRSGKMWGQLGGLRNKIKLCGLMGRSLGPILGQFDMKDERGMGSSQKVRRLGGAWARDSLVGGKAG